MKPISQLHYSKISWNQIARSPIFSAFILTAILSFSTTVVSLNTAIAAPNPGGTSRQERPQSDRLPPQVANAVRQDLSRRTRIAPGQIRITQSSPETWPNGCLGLAEPDQVCTQALVEGWRVVVSSGGKTWVYRTNATGSVVKLEPGTNQTSDASTLKPIKIPTSELPPPLTTGAANFITVTLTSSSSTIRYADIVQNNLPQPLQEVIQAWNQIASAR